VTPGPGDSPRLGLGVTKARDGSAATTPVRRCSTHNRWRNWTAASDTSFIPSMARATRLGLTLF